MEGREGERDKALLCALKINSCFVIKTRIIAGNCQKKWERNMEFLKQGKLNLFIRNFKLTKVFI